MVIALIAFGISLIWLLWKIAELLDVITDEIDKDD